MYMSIYVEAKKIKHNKQYQYLVIKRGSLNAIKKNTYEWKETSFDSIEISTSQTDYFLSKYLWLHDGIGGILG